MIVRWPAGALGLIALVLVAACSAPSPTPPDPGGPVVRTSQGELRGTADATTVRFQDIPYAAPPVGDRRWTPPDPAPTWIDRRDATRPGPRCPQASAPIGYAGVGHPAADPGTSEDCLTLSVTTPARAAAGAGLPVLVWLHGGGFTGGSGSDYDPRQLVAGGQVVVVTVNYRLGALGFLSWPGLPGEGDFGLLDQQAALRWVQREIGAFGGDPARVTLAGESAGAESVCAQLTSPGAAGLFVRAILQSSSCTSADIVDALLPGTAPASDIWKPLPYAEAAAGQLATTTGCTDPATALACLRSLPASTLNGPVGYWSPTTGTPTLPQRPSDAIAAGQWARVPVLIGTNKDEGIAFVVDAYRADPLDPSRFYGLLAQVAGAKAGAAASAYPLGPRTPNEAWAQVMGDRGYSCPNMSTYAVLAAQVPTFAYEFGEPPSLSPHSTELPYLFTIPGGQPAQSPGQEALGAAMRGQWARFVTTGDPGAGWPRFGVDGPVLALAAAGSRPMTTSEFAAAHHCEIWT